MALNIKNEEAERIVVAVTRMTGESKTQAVITALRERLERLSGRRTVPDLRTVLKEVSNRCASLPLLDKRTADEILAYGEEGTF